MAQDQWAAVDQYFGELMLRSDPTLDSALAASEAAGLPPIAVTPALGNLLHLLVRASNARRVLEIGTLGGYSTIWLGRALPEGGRLTSLEVDQTHAEVARTNIANAGLADRVEVRVGPALESLPLVAQQHPDPFDMVFIDADKESNSAYFDWALRLSRPGAVIIVDNVVRDGQVVDPDNADPRVQGSRRFAELVAERVDEGRVSATTIQTVGSKGWDGFTLVVVADGATPPRG